MKARQANDCCRHAPLLMEWALLEADNGNDSLARELFSQGAKSDKHAPLLAAWAEFEEQRNRCFTSEM
jgi:pre-mRNA-processing factor 6